MSTVAMAASSDPPPSSVGPIASRDKSQSGSSDKSTRTKGPSSRGSKHGGSKNASSSGHSGGGYSPRGAISNDSLPGWLRVGAASSGSLGWHSGAPHLPTSPHISPHRPTSPYISHISPPPRCPTSPVDYEAHEFDFEIESGEDDDADDADDDEEIWGDMGPSNSSTRHAMHEEHHEGAPRFARDQPEAHVENATAGVDVARSEGTHSESAHSEPPSAAAASSTWPPAAAAAAAAAASSSMYPPAAASVGTLSAPSASEEVPSDTWPPTGVLRESTLRELFDKSVPSEETLDLLRCLGLCIRLHTEPPDAPAEGSSESGGGNVADWRAAIQAHVHPGAAAPTSVTSSLITSVTASGGGSPTPLGSPSRLRRVTEEMASTSPWTMASSVADAGLGVLEEGDGDDGEDGEEDVEASEEDDEEEDDEEDDEDEDEDDEEEEGSEDSSGVLVSLLPPKPIRSRVELYAFPAFLREARRGREPNFLSAMPASLASAPLALAGRIIHAAELDGGGSSSRAAVPSAAAGGREGDASNDGDGGSGESGLAAGVQILESVPTFEGLERHLIHVIQVVLRGAPPPVSDVDASADDRADASASGRAAKATAAAAIPPGSGAALHSDSGGEASTAARSDGGGSADHGSVSGDGSAEGLIVYTIRRRYRDFKALHAALSLSHHRATLPHLPPSELKFLVKPPEEIIRAHAAKMQLFLQQVCGIEPLGRAGALERFLDASGRVARYVDNAIPPVILHGVQSLLAQVRTSTHLHASPCTSTHLHASPRISTHLHASPRIFTSLPISPHLSRTLMAFADHARDSRLAHSDCRFALSSPSAANACVRPGDPFASRCACTAAMSATQWASCLSRRPPRWRRPLGGSMKCTLSSPRPPPPTVRPFPSLRTKSHAPSSRRFAAARRARRHRRLRSSRWRRTTMTTTMWPRPSLIQRASRVSSAGMRRAARFESAA